MSTIVAEPQSNYSAQPKTWLAFVKYMVTTDFIDQFNRTIQSQIGFNELIVPQTHTEAAESKATLNFKWEGGLKELNKEFDGVKLQHHINSLRK